MSPSNPKVTVVLAVAMPFLTTTSARAATSPAAIEARLRALEAEVVKLRREAREARTQAQSAQAHAVKVCFGVQI
jgi:phosphate-selective porin OprO/OprP